MRTINLMGSNPTLNAAPYPPSSPIQKDMLTLFPTVTIYGIKSHSASGQSKVGNVENKSY